MSRLTGYSTKSSQVNTALAIISERTPLDPLSPTSRLLLSASEHPTEAPLSRAVRDLLTSPQGAGGLVPAVRA